MNALVGHKAKLNIALLWRRCDAAAHDGSGQDGADLSRALASGHLGGRCKFEGWHDGSEEWETSAMMRGIW